MRSRSIAGVIPARYASTRFPGKPLHVIAGKPLIQHVWERCSRARKLDHLLIATDDMRIADTARKFGAEVVLTSPSHPTGTDRIAEVARKLRDVTHFINIQGDEPDLDPHVIDRIARELHRGAEMVTAACPFPDEANPDDPNMVKVVLNRKNQALYFSRSRIPADRDKSAPVSYLLHQGIYGYSRELLLQYVRWRPTPLELAEKLEQLRALEYGKQISVITTDHPSIGVDTPADARRVARILKSRQDPRSNAGLNTSRRSRIPAWPY